MNLRVSSLIFQGKGIESGLLLDYGWKLTRSSEEEESTPLVHTA